MQAGSASIDITPPLGTTIQGASVANVAESIRDPLEANALYLQHDDEALLLVSIDLAGLHPDVVAGARRRIAESCEIAEDAIILACTHTHTGPVVLWTNYRKPVDPAMQERLVDHLVAVSRQAMAEPFSARLRWGQGQAQIGYNRRCCWADGTHSMHGDTSREDFTGLEGPDDPTHTALFVEDSDGQLRAILHHNTTHPTCFYGRPFFSADIPGATRGHLRRQWPDLPVLFLNGAFGDISNGNQLSTGADGGEQAMRRAAHLLTGETLRLHDHAQPLAPSLVHRHELLELPLRQVPPDHLDWARGILARVDDGDDSVDSWSVLRAHGAVYLADDLGATPTDTLRLHAWHLGPLAFLSQPLELYCQFGLDIRRRSPFPATCVVGIADGYHGYCPTLYGILGGGYSGEPIWWTRFAPEAGYLLVDHATRMLHQFPRQG